MARIGVVSLYDAMLIDAIAEFETMTCERFHEIPCANKQRAKRLEDRGYLHVADKSQRGSNRKPLNAYALTTHGHSKYLEILKFCDFVREIVKKSNWQN